MSYSRSEARRKRRQYEALASDVRMIISNFDSLNDSFISATNNIKNTYIVDNIPYDKGVVSKIMLTCNEKNDFLKRTVLSSISNRIASLDRIIDRGRD